MKSIKNLLIVLIISVGLTTVSNAQKKNSAKPIFEDREFMLWTEPEAELVIDLDTTSITLPIAGESRAFEKAVSAVKQNNYALSS